MSELARYMADRAPAPALEAAIEQARAAWAAAGPARYCLVGGDGAEVVRPHGTAWPEHWPDEAAGPSERWGTRTVPRRFDASDLDAMLDAFQREVRSWRTSGYGTVTEARYGYPGRYIEVRLQAENGNRCRIILRRETGA